MLSCLISKSHWVAGIVSSLYDSRLEQNEWWCEDEESPQQWASAVREIWSIFTSSALPNNNHHLKTLLMRRARTAHSARLSITTASSHLSSRPRSLLSYVFICFMRYKILRHIEDECLIVKWGDDVQRSVKTGPFLHEPNYPGSLISPVAKTPKSSFCWRICRDGLIEMNILLTSRVTAPKECFFN